MNKTKFSLTSNIYAARFDNAIILLNSSNDKYLSFIDSAAQYFQMILSGEFQYDSNKKFLPIKKLNGKFNSDVEELNYWINHFVENNFIEECHNKEQKLIAIDPLQSGGLIEYQWDHKTSWKPFALASKLGIIKAIFELARVHKTMKQKGIGGVLNSIKKIKNKHKNLFKPTDKEIKKLASAVDAATILYPKKTFCLAWASTFVLLALKKNWKSSLVIGIQTNPFYAHAWAQIDGKVVHDDPVIAKVLSIILKEPNF